MLRFIRQKGINKFGFTTQILDITRLERRLTNVELKNGNYINMGVELNPYGKPVAYHIKKYNNKDTMMAGINLGDYERIPAEDVIHYFVAEQAEQVRGFTWLHSVMINLNNLDAYQEAAIMERRISASSMIFITNNNTSDGTDLADYENDNGELIKEMDPGAISVLPQGMDVKSVSPSSTAGEYETFIKATLRSIASGLNISYNTLASDVSDVNYSSGRIGTISERDHYTIVQNSISESILTPIYLAWLETAMLNNAIKFYNGTPLPIDKLDKFSKHKFKGRRWLWVDPLKDINASIQAVEYGFKTRSDIIAEYGGDLEQTFLQLQKEQELAKKYGLDLSKNDNIYNAVMKSDMQNNDNAK